MNYRLLLDSLNDFENRHKHMRGDYSRSGTHYSNADYVFLRSVHLALKTATAQWRNSESYGSPGLQNYEDFFDQMERSSSEKPTVSLDALSRDQFPEWYYYLRSATENLTSESPTTRCMIIYKEFKVTLEAQVAYIENGVISTSVSSSSSASPKAIPSKKAGANSHQHDISKKLLLWRHSGDLVYDYLFEELLMLKQEFTRMIVVSETPGEYEAFEVLDDYGNYYTDYKMIAAPSKETKVVENFKDDFFKMVGELLTKHKNSVNNTMSWVLAYADDAEMRIPMNELSLIQLFSSIHHAAEKLSNHQMSPPELKKIQTLFDLFLDKLKEKSLEITGKNEPLRHVLVAL